MQEFKQVVEAIRKNRTFLISSHIRGDGDSIGSALALSRALRQAGKVTVTSIDSQVPDMYHFLPDVKRIVPPARVKRRFDAVIALDTPTRERLGAAGALLARCATVISIDHHRTASQFAAINWLDDGMSSVGEMVYVLLKALRLPMDDTIAQNLYTAIVTDTGRFTYSNTRPSSLRIAAELMEAGLDFREIARNVYQSTTREVFALRALAMETVHFALGGRVGIMLVTHAMFKKTGARPINTQDFVDIPRSIKGVAVAALIHEMEKPGWVKVSLRSDSSLESDKVAALFGGGGHARAAGCEIQGPIEDVQRRVLAAIRARIKKA